MATLGLMPEGATALEVTSSPATPPPVRKLSDAAQRAQDAINKAKADAADAVEEFAQRVASGEEIDGAELSAALSAAASTPEAFDQRVRAIVALREAVEVASHLPELESEAAKVQQSIDTENDRHDAAIRPLNDAMGKLQPRLKAARNASAYVADNAPGWLRKARTRVATRIKRLRELLAKESPEVSDNLQGDALHDRQAALALAQQQAEQALPLLEARRAALSELATTPNPTAGDLAAIDLCHPDPPGIKNPRARGAYGGDVFI